MQAKYRVPEQNLLKLQEQLDKINKKAKKLSFPETTITVTSVEDIPFVRDSVTLYRRYANIIINGETPKINGWEFAATVDYIEGLALIRAIPGFSIPQRFRETKGECDHCQKIRNRSQTFIVYNGYDSKVVGRNCLSDFLGSIDPHDAAKMAELLANFNEDAELAEDEGWGYGGGGVYRYSLLGYLCYVAEAIRRFGWCSKGNAKLQDKDATADIAFRRMTKEDNEQGIYAWTPSEDAMKDAQTALDFCRANLSAETTNDYLYNLWVVTKSDALAAKFAGIAASALNYWMRETKEAKEREQTVPSQWLGNVGDKMLNVPAIVEGTNTIDGSYGAVTVIRLKAENDVLVWFASGYHEYERGEKVIIKSASVKKLDEYKGVKQTIITRAKLVTTGSN